MVIFCKYFTGDSCISFEIIDAVSKAEVIGKAVERCKEIKGGSLDTVDYKIVSKDDLIKKLLD